MRKKGEKYTIVFQMLVLQVAEQWTSEQVNKPEVVPTLNELSILEILTGKLFIRSTIVPQKELLVSVKLVPDKGR